MQIHSCVKEKKRIFCAQVMTFLFISVTVIFLLVYVKQLIIINYQSLSYGVK